MGEHVDVAEGAESGVHLELSQTGATNTLPTSTIALALSNNGC